MAVSDERLGARTLLQFAFEARSQFDETDARAACDVATRCDDRTDEVNAAGSALRDAFAALQRGPRAERSELASMAAFLATLGR